MTSLVGSQTVPYIYEDYASVDKIADALMEMFELGPDGRRKLGLKAKRYVEEEFSHEKTIDLWHNTMKDTVENWRDRRKRWICETI
jgi:glycosyltransferase involved in cell wall biosynthesis